MRCYESTRYNFEKVIQENQMKILRRKSLEKMDHNLLSQFSLDLGKIQWEFLANWIATFGPVKRTMPIRWLPCAPVSDSRLSFHFSLSQGGSMLCVGEPGARQTHTNLTFTKNTCAFSYLLFLVFFLRDKQLTLLKLMAMALKQ